MKEALRLFISHSWAEKELVRKIEAELTSSNIEFWVDHSAIRVGDNLPERISTALEWSNTLLLIWSKTASNSVWVKLEWTNAISLQKAVIPCIIDNTSLPAILANKVYIDFRNVEQGILKLRHALQIAKDSKLDQPNDKSNQIAHIIHQQISINPNPPIPKPPQSDNFIHRQAELTPNFFFRYSKHLKFLIFLGILVLIGLFWKNNILQLIFSESTNNELSKQNHEIHLSEIDTFPNPTKVLEAPFKYRHVLFSNNQTIIDTSDARILGLIWIVYSDRENNPTYLYPNSNEIKWGMHFFEEFYVCQEFQNYLRLVKDSNIKCELQVEKPFSPVVIFLLTKEKTTEGEGQRWIGNFN